MWEIKEVGYKKENIIHFGNKFLIGNLKLGVRGTLDEYRKEQLVGLNLPLIYDQVGFGWREPINGFNPLYTTIKVNGLTIDILHYEPTYHEQTLNMKTGMMERISIFKKDFLEVTIKSRRYVSLCDDRTIIGTYEVTCNQDTKIEIFSGIDLDVWDIHGPHIKDINKKLHHSDLLVKGKTNENNHDIALLKRIEVFFDYDFEQIDSNNLMMNHYTIEGKKNSIYKFNQYAVFQIDSNDEELFSLLDSIQKIGFDAYYLKHQILWQKKWDDSDVLIEGNDEAQRALRYSIYHLLVLSPSGYKHASIPARGISGQTYKGAIFWDTEIFMLPFYLNTDWESARQIITYRIEGLEGAKTKARHYGFEGAFYAWESQENGYDACSDYNVTDVFTHRPLRTYFRDKQIHISGDIVYAINSYFQRTNDLSILIDGGLKVILEVARFYLDYGRYSILDDRFEIWDVMGPDEYHERVHNNAFTNQLVLMVFQTVLEYQTLFMNNDDSFFELLIQELNYQDTLLKLSEIVNKTYIKQTNQYGIIEQFDGYFDLKDISITELLKLKLKDNEYLGGHGLAGDTKIIKQADVIAMLYLFKENYDISVLVNNFEYYEPKTEHGSSLS
ncbi:MAG: hypothetical protein WCR19_00740, partial [Acholeplasmataceae bacterium]